MFTTTENDPDMSGSTENNWVGIGFADLRFHWAVKR